MRPSRMPFTHDAIIIGHGLAGAVFCETLASRGLRVMVFDAALEGRASWVAAGVVNPIVLRRTVPSWRASELLAIAGAFYREMELDYETELWKSLPLAEIFPTAQEAAIWQLRMREPELSRMIGTGPLHDDGLEKLPQPYGHGVVLRSGWLNIRAMLDAQRARLSADGSFAQQRVSEEDMRRSPDGIAIHDCSAPLLIHCAGPFKQVPGVVPVRGEGITVRMRGLGLNCLLHRGAFVVPRGDDVYRIGSTFAWDDVWSGPTEEGRRLMMDRVQRLWNGEMELLDHWAGVRPGSKDRRPILGRIGAHEAVLTGLGSRGALLAPWCAEHLTKHLLDGEPLDPEVDQARFT